MMMGTPSMHSPILYINVSLMQSLEFKLIRKELFCSKLPHLSINSCLSLYQLNLYNNGSSFSKDAIATVAAAVAATADVSIWSCPNGSYKSQAPFNYVSFELVHVCEIVRDRECECGKSIVIVQLFK